VPGYKDRSITVDHAPTLPVANLAGSPSDGTHLGHVDTQKVGHNCHRDSIQRLRLTKATCNENLKGIIQTGNDPVGALIDGGIAEFLAVLGGEADRPEVVQIPAHDGHHV